MDHHRIDSEKDGARRTTHAGRRRRAAGALLTGAALALGTALPADAGTRTSLQRSQPLYDNCGTGFSGSFSWTDGTARDTVRVTFTTGEDYVGRLGEVDVRGVATTTDDKGRQRPRTVRLGHEYDALPAGTHTVTFTAPPGVEIYRAGVLAEHLTIAGDDVHALDGEQGPCD